VALQHLALPLQLTHWFKVRLVVLVQKLKVAVLALALAKVQLQVV
jgi:hypothetical protein